jgi:ubiquinone/menaquinone biosynthesis C-methylase UbiE
VAGARRRSDTGLDPDASSLWRRPCLSAGPSNALLDLDSLLAAGRTLRPAGRGVVSALPTDDPGAPYDRKAAVYDRIVGARAYNRVVWGTSTAAYRDLAFDALASGTGPMLDAGCGSAVFTADAYRRASRPLVLVDRSVGMLARASGRLEGAPAALVQADLSDLPFAPGSFTTVACFGTLHVLDDPWSALAALWRQVTPRGQLFASMLITDRALGGAYLRVLQRAGEVGPPRSRAELAAAARQACGDSAAVDRTGSMAWLRARKAAA